MVENILPKSWIEKYKDILRIISIRTGAFGELGHPDGPSINLERVSHMIKSLKKEGNNYVGKSQDHDRDSVWCYSGKPN